MRFKDINECIAFIESQRRKEGSTKNLNDMLKLCEYFGSPQKALKCVHVAGTNGKGSTLAYLTSILMKAGYKVGSYTSPYIEVYNERIEINRINISNEKLLEYTNHIVSKYDDLEKKGYVLPSFFALTTLIAFMYFKDENVDIAIIEAGIGGLLDDTNVIDSLVSVITNVNYDHMNILGNTIEEIAKNKLGIIKENSSFVSISNPIINNLMIDTCRNKNASFKIVSKDDIKIKDLSLFNTIFDYKQYKNIKLRMLGSYQAENACLAIEASEFLRYSSFNISDDNIIDGLEEAFWLGRLELVQRDPIILLDGAHNVDAFNRLIEFIKSIKSTYKIRLVLAISANKDISNMLAMIDDELIDELILTSFAYKRSDEAINLFNLSDHKNKFLIENNLEILERVNNDENRDQTLTIFSGSLYFVSELRKIFKL